MNKDDKPFILTKVYRLSKSDNHNELILVFELR